MSLSRGLTFDCEVYYGLGVDPVSLPITESSISCGTHRRHPKIMAGGPVYVVPIAAWQTARPNVGDSWDFNGFPFWISPADDGTLFVPGDGVVFA